MGKRGPFRSIGPPGMIICDQTMRGLRSYMIIQRGRSDQLRPLRSYASNSSRSSDTKDRSDHRLLCISCMIACYSTMPPFADGSATAGARDVSQEYQSPRVPHTLVRANANANANANAKQAREAPRSSIARKHTPLWLLSHTLSRLGRIGEGANAGRIATSLRNGRHPRAFSESRAAPPSPSRVLLRCPGAVHN